MMSIRKLLCALPVAALGALPVSSYAASDAALIQSYVGNYTGTGALTGAHSGTVRCRIAFQPATATSVNYVGRCSAEGTAMSLTGVITAEKGRIQAAMSGNDGMSATVTGVRRSDGFVFSSKQHMARDGHDGTVSSTMALVGGTIQVQFSMLDNKTGKTTTGTIPFVKLTR